MSLRAALLALAFTLIPAAALADLPPPDGTRFVGYAFRVDGLGKFPDHMLVAYPWSLSNGAPTREHAVVADGVPVAVGRRSAPPALYAVRKAAYDELKKNAQPPGGAEGDPALESFLAGAAKCDLAPRPSFTVDSDDPRDKIVEAFRAETINDTTCHLVTGAAPEDAKAVTDPAQDELSPPARGGCAGCAVGEGATRAGPFGLAALFAGVSLGRRRRRRTGA